MSRLSLYANESRILVCIGEDWPVLRLLYFLSKIITVIKMKCFELMRICDSLIMGLFTWRRGPQIGEVTSGGSPNLSRKRCQIKMGDYMDRRVTPPKRVTSPTWGPPPPCKQALNVYIVKTTDSCLHFPTL